MGKSRGKKYQQFIYLTNPAKDSTILDVGAANEEYSPYTNYLEKRYPYPSKITALSIHPLKKFSERYPEVKAVTYNGGNFPFKGKQFSIVVSNAVIEHVGGKEKQLFFIREMNRVGHQFYFTTPAKEFPIEIHTNYPFLHWFNDANFDHIVTWLGKGWASGNYMNLLRKKDINNLMRESNVSEYKILTHRFVLIPLHYAVWGR
ncbi:MAG: class I SAM-dependent methyltransferase [Thermodesulfobacteriota bacterium]|nr:class I SAM-dependent methyltransferase [Thermodesulfobacteriota bacterium]